MSNLPKGWERSKIGEVCKFSQGVQIPIEEQLTEKQENYIRFLRISDYTQNTTDIRYVPNSYNNNIISKEEIVMVRYGETAGHIGRGFYGVLANNLFTINPTTEKLSKDFLYIFMKQPSMYNYLKKLRASGAMPAVNFKSLSIIELPIPPLEEQKKIADILSTVDKKIAFVEENINATEELKKGLMQKLLTEGIGHTEFKDSELGRIPESWEVGKIMDILTIKYGKSQKEVENPNGDYPILGSGGLMGYANGYLYDKPSVLIGRKGTIDKPQYIEKPFWTVDTLFYSDIKLDNLPLFVYYLFLTIDWRKYNEASGVPSLSVNNIHNIKISIPPLEEQKQIAEILSTVDKKIENLKEKKQSFEELKKGLMQKLLTGEVRV